MPEIKILGRDSPHLRTITTQTLQAGFNLPETLMKSNPREIYGNWNQYFWITHSTL